MANIRKQLPIIYIIVVAAIFGSMVLLHGALAATGRIYISPATKSVQNGTTFTVELRINPGGRSADGVQATLNFDAAKLQYVGRDAGGSAFPVGIIASQTATSATTERATFGTPPTTDVLIERFSFKAIAGSGTTSISVSNAKGSDSNGLFDTAVAGTQVSLTTPPPTPTPTPDQTPNPVPTTPKPTPNPDNQQPSTPTERPTTTTRVTSDVAPELSVNDTIVAFTQARFKVSTNKPTRAYIAYGLDAGALVQTPLSALSMSHSIELDETILQPGTAYVYKIVLADEAGNVSESPIKSFKTKGFTVIITIVDKRQQPLVNQQVTLRSDPITVKTDTSGRAVFTDIAPGTHTLTYRAQGKDYEQPVEIDNTITTDGDGRQTAVDQHISVIMPLEASRSYVLAVVGGVSVLAIGISIICWYRFIRPRRHVRLASVTASPLPAIVQLQPPLTINTATPPQGQQLPQQPVSTPVVMHQVQESVPPGRVIHPESDIGQ